MQATSHLPGQRHPRSEPRSTPLDKERWTPVMTVTFVAATSTTLWMAIIVTASWLIG